LYLNLIQHGASFLPQRTQRLYLKGFIKKAQGSQSFVNVKLANFTVKQKKHKLCVLVPFWQIQKSRAQKKQLNNHKELFQNNHVFNFTNYLTSFLYFMRSINFFSVLLRLNFEQLYLLYMLTKLLLKIIQMYHQ
jgi:hypothetical protein